MNNKVIPAMDIMDGKCVRLKKGDFSNMDIYYKDPMEFVRELSGEGISRVHVVDLDGARLGHVVHFSLLERICSHKGMCIDFGGGIQHNDDLRRVFEAGADYASISSVAVTEGEKMDSWISEFGPGRFILCPDVSNGYIQISGWTVNSELNVDEFIALYKEKGIIQFLCTDINRDGMMRGPSFGLYRHLLSEFPDIDLIASGGVTDMEDIKKLLQLGVAGVITGKAVFEGRIAINEIASLSVGDSGVV